MRTAIRGVTCVTPEHELPARTVVIHDTVIGEISSDPNAGHDADLVIDAQHAVLAPGLIDLHTHGGGGADIMSGTEAAVQALGQFLARHGVTSYLPTTVSAGPDELTTVIDAVAPLLTAPQAGGARPLGVHLEGPFLAHSHRGAQTPSALRLPDPVEYRSWFEGGVVKLVTAAPELTGAPAMIAAAAAADVRVAVGHTAADYEQAVVAFDRGADQVTHTFNGMPGLHHREPGMIGAALTDGRVYAQIIVDGHHLHPAVVDLVVRAKGPGRTLLVSDSIVAAGLPDDEYELGPTWIRVTDGVPRTQDGGLAGSVLTLDAAVRNVREATGLPLRDCLAMATSSPAAAMGWSATRGHLRVGREADLTLCTTELEVLATWVAGDLVHRHPSLEVRR